MRSIREWRKKGGTGRIGGNGERRKEKKRGGEGRGEEGRGKSYVRDV